MQQTAVITGASYGLGGAISKNLLASDYKVYGVSRTEPQIHDVNFIWIKADLSNENDIKSISKQISEDRIDLLINNVGVCFFKNTLDYSDDDFEKMFGLNFKSQVKVTQLLFLKLTGGLIMNISSLSDRYPDPGWGLYGSSKTALNLFFETMAAENKEVKILNILPSYIDTPMQHDIRKNDKDFDWSMCMRVEDVAIAVDDILANSDKIGSGSRIIIEQNIDPTEKYTPEKLWTYSVSDTQLRNLR